MMNSHFNYLTNNNLQTLQLKCFVSSKIIEHLKLNFNYKNRAFSIAKNVQGSQRFVVVMVKLSRARSMCTLKVVSLEYSPGR